MIEFSTYFHIYLLKGIFLHCSPFNFKYSNVICTEKGTKWIKKIRADQSHRISSYRPDQLIEQHLHKKQCEARYNAPSSMYSFFT